MHHAKVHSFEGKGSLSLSRQVSPVCNTVILHWVLEQESGKTGDEEGVLTRVYPAGTGWVRPGKGGGGSPEATGGVI